MINYVEIKQHVSAKYTPRTYYNAKSADLTLAYAIDFTTAGEKCTHKAAGKNYIALKYDDDITENARSLYKELRNRKVNILNIAGNGIYTFSKYNITQEKLNFRLFDILKLVHQHFPISKIISGGQTGTDFAAGVVAEVLEIPCVMTFPHGYIQRFEDRKDVNRNYESIINDLNNQVEKLKTYVYRNEV